MILAYTLLLFFGQVKILNRADVHAAVDELRREAFTRGKANLKIEYVVLVRPADSPYPLDWIAGSREDVMFPWDNQILAVVHTHLDEGFEQPSTVDIDLAKTHHVPIYVISANQIWMADITGEVRRVQ